MDRDFLGWQGRYFLHNVSLSPDSLSLLAAQCCVAHGLHACQVSHCHVVHHFFPELPHCTSFIRFSPHISSLQRLISFLPSMMWCAQTTSQRLLNTQRNSLDLITELATHLYSSLYGLTNCIASTLTVKVGCAQWSFTLPDYRRV